MLRFRMCLLLLTLGPANLAGQRRTDVDLAMPGAMPIEVQLLRTRFGDAVVRTIGGIEFAQGTLSGHSVVVARPEVVLLHSFWIGSGVTVLGAEWWIRRTRPARASGLRRTGPATSQPAPPSASPPRAPGTPLPTAP